jgi:anthranilate phosphoribosyltransferase
MSQGNPNPHQSEVEPTWDQVISQLADGENLNGVQATWAMNQILDNLATKDEIKSFLLGVQAKGESAAEVEAFLEVMFSHSAPIQISERAVDPVGTGGDGANTINISSTAAIIAAAAGAKVVKHGARAASSTSGAADLLEALGVNIDLDGQGVETCFQTLGIGFCFAPKFHPAMRFAAPARKELGQASVFNILGPLANPAKPQAMAIGVAKERVLPLMAKVLADRGAEGFLFRGDDGLDEITLTTTSTIIQVSKAGMKQERFDPRELGVEYAPIEAITGGDASYNAAVTLDILSGRRSPARDAVLLNAAAAIAAFDAQFELSITEQLRQGLSKAAAAVDSGSALALLQRWVELSQSLKESLKE